MSQTIHPSVGNGVYSSEEQAAAKIVAACIGPNYPGAIPSREADLGYYNSLVDQLLDPYQDTDIQMLIAARKGEAYDPRRAAETAWAGLQEMTGTVTPYQRLVPLVEALISKTQPAMPLDVIRMPAYDKAGVVYCPTHRAKRLIASKNGNGWRCPEHDCFWWKGEGYVEPVAISVPAEAAAEVTHKRLWLTEHEVDTTLVPPEMLVRDVVVAEEVTVVFGLGDSGKTFIVVDIAMRIAQHYPVLYVAGEDGSGIKIRKAAWQRHYNRPANGNFFLVNGPVNLMDAGAVDEFITQAHALNLKLIVFDTLSQCSAGADDSSNKEMSILTANANRIAHELHTSVIIIHHTTKGGENYRGASCIKDNTYGFLRVEKDDDAISFECVRIKNTDVFKPRKYRLIADIDTGVMKRDGTVATSCVIAPAIRTVPSDALTNSEIKILEVAAYVCKAQGHVGATELQRATGLEGKKFWGPLGKLRDKGMLFKAEQRTAPYTLTERAKTFLNSAYKEDRSQYDSNDQEPDLFEINLQLGAEVTSFLGEVTPKLLPGTNQGSNTEVTYNTNSTFRTVVGYDDTWEEGVTTEVTGSNVTSSPSSPLLGGGKGVTEGSNEGTKETVAVTPAKPLLDWAYLTTRYEANDMRAIQVHCAMHKADLDRVMCKLEAVPETEDV